MYATFSRHRQKCSDGLPRFGCRARKDFYHQNGLWIGLKAVETSAFKNKTKEQLVEMRNAAVRELAAVLSEEPGPKGVYIKCLPDKLNIFGLRYVGQGDVRRRQLDYGGMHRHIVPDNYSSFEPKAFGAKLQMLLLAEELSDKFARTIEYALIQMLDLPTNKFINLNYPFPFVATKNDAGETAYINMLPEGVSDSDLRSLVAPLLFIALELREELAIDMSGRGQQKMDADAPLISTPTSSMESLDQWDEMPGTSAASEDPWQRHAPKGWEQKPAKEWTKTDREIFSWLAT
uniref:CRAL-TRIO domain-containing protein n=1 Tax=Globodera pallida TaxID=36090 RepID=A0A183CQC8_GLOPA